MNTSRSSIWSAASRPLATALLALCVLPAAALSLNKHGTGAPLPCKQYQVLSKAAFEGGKALSADAAEYFFSAQMSEGAGGGECGAATVPYIAKITARWDGTTKQATEIIQHQPPAIGKITQVTSSCTANPWISEANPACTLMKVTTDNINMYAPAIAGPYPVSAYFAGSAVRRDIARLVSWTGSSDFILPPTTAPQIMAADDGRDIDGRFYRRNQDVQAFVRRPVDGSPQWYAQHLQSYDVEVQVKTTTAEGWINNPAGGTVAAAPGSFALTYARLFGDPDTQWAVENMGERGYYRPVRVRARISDAAGSRPWSVWRSFLVEVPLRIKDPVIKRPLPGGLDTIPKSGGK